MKTVLLAGATGVLGRHVASELTARGYRVRRLVRDNAGPEDWLGDLRHPTSLRGAVQGVDAVISCAGASMRLDDWSDRWTFHEIDWAGNKNLLDAAEVNGIRKFVYVSLANGPELRKTAYAGAHERFVDALASSGLRYTVVRPTGLYAFFGQLVKMAAQGRGLVIGDGSSQTNPIHEADAARACVEALSWDVDQLPVGGPVVYTRWEIASLAFWALGASPAIRSLPGWAMAPVPLLLRLANPRIASLVEFGTRVSQMDSVAPQYGIRTLEDYFRELIRRQYGQWRSPRNPSSSSANSKRTTTASGFNREKIGTTA